MKPTGSTGPVVPVFGSLIKEDGHDGEQVVRLEHQLFGDEELPRPIDIRRWVRDRPPFPGLLKLLAAPVPYWTENA